MVYFVTAEKVGLVTSPPYLSLVSKIKFNKKNVSFLHGVNFASGGAGIFNGTDPNIVSVVLILSFPSPILYLHVCTINLDKSDDLDKIINFIDLFSTLLTKKGEHDIK